MCCLRVAGTWPLWRRRWRRGFEQNCTRTSALNIMSWTEIKFFSKEIYGRRCVWNALQQLDAVHYSVVEKWKKFVLWRAELSVLWSFLMEVSKTYSRDQTRLQKINNWTVFRTSYRLWTFYIKTVVTKQNLSLGNCYQTYPSCSQWKDWCSDDSHSSPDLLAPGQHLLAG